MDLDGARLTVTGAGGFIGLRMVERALERGMHVRGLDLSPEAVARVEAAGAEGVVGDVTDEASVRRLCEGADVVFHAAAIISEAGDWAVMRRVNVEGTRLAARVAAESGARRFVQLSSCMVHGFTFPRYVDEDGPLRGENNPYCQTKIESERVAMSFHEPGAMEVIVIRPGDVYGPGSVPWVVRPIELIRSRMMALPDGGRGIMNHVYVDNLIDAIVLALEKDATGEAFLVTDGAETTFAEYFGRLARMVGRRWIPTAPRPLLRAVLGLAGRWLPADVEGVEFLSRPHPYSIGRARRVLGYEPRVDLDEGMRRTEAWVRASLT